MPKPRIGADPPQSGCKNKRSQPSQSITRSPNDRLHLALMVALGAVALLAIVFPVTRSKAGAEDSSTAPVLAVSDGFAAALQSQAQTLVGALSQAGPVATPQGAALSRNTEELPGIALVPRPLLVAAASAVVQGAFAGPEGQAGLVTELQQPVRFTLNEEGFPSAVFSTRSTVGGALTALGAEYGRYDRISPPPDTPLTAGLHVFLEHATAVRLGVGGEDPAKVYTHADTVAALLAERGVELSKSDSVTPALSTPLSDGLVISVTVVREEVEVEDTPIPFLTYYRDDPTLTEGEYVEVEAGVDGYVRREYAIVYESGEEVSRELTSEYTVWPTDRIIAQGTAVTTAVASAVAAPEPPPVAAPVTPESDPGCPRTLSVWATWYTAASAGGGGTTATGTAVAQGTVAVDPQVIPLGTRMYIPGYGYGVAEDTGGAIIGNIIDLGYGPSDVFDWTSGYVDICILD